MDKMPAKGEIRPVGIYLIALARPGVESACKEPEIFTGSALVVRGLA